MNSVAEIRFNRKVINSVLVRCKNGAHRSSKQKAMQRDLRRLEQNQ